MRKATAIAGRLSEHMCSCDIQIFHASQLVPSNGLCYRQSRDKEKFLRGHESEIILFEAAARELKRLGAVPLPAAQRLRAEMDELTARKSALQSEYRKAQHKEREYDM